MAITVTVNGRPVGECPRKCLDCRGALHHWIEHFPDVDEPEDNRDREIIADWLKWRYENPTEAPECPIAWVCKHCPIWFRHYDTCGDCDGPIDENGDCISDCGGTVGEFDEREEDD